MKHKSYQIEYSTSDGKWAKAGIVTTKSGAIRFAKKQALKYKNTYRVVRYQVVETWTPIASFKP